MVNWLGFDPGGKCWPTKHEALESIPSITENKIYNIWPKYKERHTNRHIFCSVLDHKMVVSFHPRLSTTFVSPSHSSDVAQQTGISFGHLRPTPYKHHHFHTCLHSHCTSVVGGSKEMVCFRMSNYLRYQEVKIVWDTSNPSEETGLY